MADGRVVIHVEQDTGISKISSSPSMSSISTKGTKLQSRPGSGGSSKAESQGSKMF